MKLSSIVALGLAATTGAVEFKACTGTNMGGSCTAKTSLGKQTGSWRSYNFRATSNRCVRVCQGCTSLGFRCENYSNNNISFNKYIIFAWADGEGPDATTCC